MMQINKDIFVKLKESVAFLQNFTDGELLVLLKTSKREVYKKEQVIFKEGTLGDEMFIIISGTVRISRYLQGGREEVLVKLETGACFGEMGVIDSTPRSASATVESDQALVLVIKEYLLREANMMLAYKLYKNFSAMLAERLRKANDKLYDASSEDLSASVQLKNLIKRKLEKGASLHGANLKGASLEGTFWSNTNMEGSVMINANMTQAKCRGANLTKAKLQGATFTAADFSEANFTGADFTGAVFNDITFNNCSFSGADFKAADFTQSQMESLIDSLKGKDLENL